MTVTIGALGAMPLWKAGVIIRGILKEQVPDIDIYPIVAPENTTGDFAIYRRDTYRREEVKQGIYANIATVTIVVVTDNYTSGTEWAEKIDKALSGVHNYEDRKIKISLYDSAETFADNKYQQIMTFEIR